MNPICKNSQNKFPVAAEDLKFYQMISPTIGGKKFEMPAPTLCFACRHQKRLAFRNEMNLYHRKCDKSGKQIISMYSPDKPYKIYDQHIWWSDEWDPMEFGQDFDFNKSFFEQYKELQLQVPRMSLNNIKAENSDYCNLAMGDRNCYLVFTADEDENCAYLRFADRNYRCFDCDYTYDSIDCYELCLNNQNLFGCIALRHKKYCILNKQYTREEYETLVPKIIEHMQKGGEWGEFFPIDLSTYAYNETVAYEYFPYGKEEVLKRGWKWIDDENEKTRSGPDYVIPEDVKDVDDEICKQILICSETSKPYKIIPQELSFCKLKCYLEAVG